MKPEGGGGGGDGKFSGVNRIFPAGGILKLEGGRGTPDKKKNLWLLLFYFYVTG